MAPLAVALVISLPVSFHLRTQLIGTGSDPGQNVWNVAWVRGWLDGYHDLYFTHQLLYPEGANLAWMTLALPSSIVAALLVPGLGLAGAYNVRLLLTLVPTVRRCTSSPGESAPTGSPRPWPGSRSRPGPTSRTSSAATSTWWVPTPSQSPWRCSDLDPIPFSYGAASTRMPSLASLVGRGQLR